MNTTDNLLRWLTAASHTTCVCGGQVVAWFSSSALVSINVVSHMSVLVTPVLIVLIVLIVCVCVKVITPVCLCHTCIDCIDCVPVLQLSHLSVLSHLYWLYWLCSCVVWGREESCWARGGRRATEKIRRETQSSASSSWSQWSSWWSHWSWSWSQWSSWWSWSWSFICHWRRSQPFSHHWLHKSSLQQDLELCALYQSHNSAVYRENFVVC